MVAPIDLTGQRFDRLICLEPNTEHKTRRWYCRCDCGNYTFAQTSKLLSGMSKSCGCIAVERMRKLGKQKITHGFSNANKTLTYKSWLSMRMRCSPNYKMRQNYFDKGVTICSQWDDFSSFLADMGERPEGTTLDRINVYGNYEPDNCRWAVNKVQQRNKRNTNYLKFTDGSRIAMDVADDLGVKKAAMSYFIKVARLMKDKYGYIPTP